MTNLREAIQAAINAHSAENGSNTPDFILAEYLISCLATFDGAVTAREKWYGREEQPLRVDAQAPAAPQPDPHVKRPRLFYYEDAENCWAPVLGDEIPGILNIEQFTDDGEVIEVEFKRFDMTDAEFAAMPQA